MLMWPRVQRVISPANPSDDASSRFSEQFEDTDAVLQEYGWYIEYFCELKRVLESSPT